MSKFKEDLDDDPENVSFRNDIKIDFQSYFVGPDLECLTDSLRDEPLLLALKLSEDLSLDTRIRFYKAAIKELSERRKDSLNKIYYFEYTMDRTDDESNPDPKVYRQASEDHDEAIQRNNRIKYVYDMYLEALGRQEKALNQGETNGRAKGGPQAGDTSPSAPTHKIRWTGTQNQLDLLFRKLVEEGLLHEDTSNTWAATIEDCFLDRAGKPFKADTMRSVRANPNNVAKGQKAKAIEDVVKHVSKESY